MFFSVFNRMTVSHFGFDLFGCSGVKWYTFQMAYLIEKEMEKTLEFTSQSRTATGRNLLEYQT